MAPGCSTYEGTTESHSTDYGIAPESVEFRASPHRKTLTVNGSKRGIASNTAVHELLECPVCIKVMYPPIHQVISILIMCFNL